MLLAFFANAPLLTFYGFVPVALGGMGNNRGAVVAGLVLGLFQQAANFLVGGIFRVVIAAAVRFQNWGWAVVGGLLSIVLGVMIWQDWPESSVWAVGLLVGIDLIFTGWTWVALALGLRTLPRPTAP